MTGGPFGDFSSPEAYRREAERAAIIGMVGKWAIHPLQVAIAQEGFSPQQSRVDEARAMRAAFHEALEQGLGAVRYKGQLVDIASLRHIDNIIRRLTIGGFPRLCRWHSGAVLSPHVRATLERGS
ncbi:hypothetical protein [Pararhodobacter aggregans]|uniref:HpcH/HpaI aldolase/citrate lyase domain-containing protein n=1 Tax=Pararhodobacter aggregans TaxID=404875 RepID=A0A2T7UV24_9RHOB|nr:hypothetical protein [Pararhodobacter aggregans]PTX04089.1 hypothetical protein C8N33_102366 [Pararhodobacter aggregans]PVE48446.1 hypothetical protein DDE23_05125 [Pararhodobacter aggregans]